MTIFGLTPTGFRRKTYADLVDEISARIRALVSEHLLLDDTTPEGNWLNVFSDELDQVWQALEELATQFDPDNAIDIGLIALSALTGIPIEGASRGRVSCDVDLDAAVSFDPGDMVAHVTNNPDNRWVNENAVTSTSAGVYQAIFVSESKGAAVAPAGTLIVIAEPLSGWNSITNPTDAQPGQDQEQVEALRIRRQRSLAASGKATVPAIRAALTAVDGVISAEVYENRTNVIDAFGQAPHSVRGVVWAGTPPAVTDEAIGETLYDVAGSGVGFVGATAVNVDSATPGEQVEVRFDYATGVDIWIQITVKGSVTEQQVVDALLAAEPPGTGEDVIAEKVKAAAVVLDGAEDVLAFGINDTAPGVGTTNIEIARDQKALFDSGRIAVTVVA